MRWPLSSIWLLGALTLAGHSSSSRFGSFFPGVQLALADSFRSTSSCIGADDEWTDCRNAHQANVKVGCGVSVTGDLDHRNLASVPKNIVGLALLKGPAYTSVGGRYTTNQKDLALPDFTSWAWRDFIGWNKLHKYIFWGDVLICTAIVLLLDLLFHIMPLLMCRCCRGCCCRRAYKRKRTNSICVLVTIIILIIVAAFAITISILYSVWIKYDIDGAQCSPWKDTYDLIFEASYSDGKQFDGLQNFAQRTKPGGEWEDNVEGIRVQANYALDNLVAVQPMAAWLETNQWLSSKLDQNSPPDPKGYSTWLLGVESPKATTATALYHQIRSATNPPSDPPLPPGISTTGTWNSASAKQTVDDSCNSVRNAMRDVRSQLVESVNDLYNDWLPSALDNFLQPLEDNKNTVNWSWIGLLIGACLPVIGLVAAVIFFIYYRVQDDYREMRRTGCSRRMTAFFIWGYAFWAIILFLVSGVLYVGLYPVSDGCSWLSDRMNDGDFGHHGFSAVDPNIMATCVNKDSDGDLAKAFGFNMSSLVDFDTSNLDVESTSFAAAAPLVQQITVTGWTIAGFNTIFSTTEVNAFHETPFSRGAGSHEVDTAPLITAWNAIWPGCDAAHLCIKGIHKPENCAATIDSTSVVGIEAGDVSSMVWDDTFSFLEPNSKSHNALVNWLDRCSAAGLTDYKKAAEAVFAAALKSTILAGGRPANPMSSGCITNCTAMLKVEEVDGNTTNVDYATWTGEALDKMYEYVKDQTKYTELCVLQTKNAGPVRAARALFESMTESYNCKPAYAKVERIRDRICSGVFGDVAIIFYCFLALALLHVLAWTFLLHYWKARQSYMDAIRNGEEESIVLTSPRSPESGPPSISEDAFLLAAEQGDLKKVKLGTETYPADTVRDIFYSNSPLHLAAFYGHEPETTHLLEKGYDPNALNYHFFTPFTACCSNRTLEWDTKKNILQKLRDYGAETEIYDYQGDTPLMAATRARDHDTVKLLLTMGANPLTQDSVLNQDSVTIAKQKNDTELVRMLSDASPGHSRMMGQFEPRALSPRSNGPAPISPTKDYASDVSAFSPGLVTVHAAEQHSEDSSQIIIATHDDDHEHRVRINDGTN